MLGSFDRFPHERSRIHPNNEADIVIRNVRRPVLLSHRTLRVRDLVPLINWTQRRQSLRVTLDGDNRRVRQAEDKSLVAASLFALPPRERSLYGLGRYPRYVVGGVALCRVARFADSKLVGCMYIARISYSVKAQRGLVNSASFVFVSKGVRDNTKPMFGYVLPLRGSADQLLCLQAFLPQGLDSIADARYQRVLMTYSR